MSEHPLAAPLETTLILSAEGGVPGQLTFVFSLSLASRRMVFRLTTKGPVSVEDVLKALGDQFGFKLPELPSIGPVKPWEALYKAKLTPELAFSPNPPRMMQGGMKLETPLEIPFIPDCAVHGVRARWQQAGGGKPAAWDFGIDVTLFGRKQTLTFPFAVPQPKPPLIDLKYFGLGQRVSPNLQGAATMAAVMEKMRTDLRQEPGDKLVERLAAFYRPDAGWLAGIWLTVRDLVDLQVIFNDPVLYGVALKAGSKLGFLKGLAFEVLYQKVSDEVGMFYIDLTLPLAMRELFMGAWSITLPSIALWIYTNGDFKVSLGWPLGDRSFTIQYLFLIGGGGFYLAKLSSATSPDMPPPPQGMTYNPVLAFGIALRLGVGREFNKGILSARLSLTLVGVFEGRVAWLRQKTALELLESGESADGVGTALVPAAESAELAAPGVGASVFDYFWFRGTFGIVGVVQGVVDFAIIKASLTVRLEASVTLTFGTGQRTVIRVQAGVRVELRVEIASFKIFGKRISISVSLSFHADISQEFVVDNGGAQHALRAAMARQEALAWTALRLPWANVRPVLPLLFAPRLTRVEGTPYFVATLTIPTKPEVGVDWSPFEALARALAEWMGEVQARADGAEGPGRAQWLDADRLEVWNTRLARARYLNLADPGNPDPLTYEQIVEFLEANFVLEIQVPPVAPAEAGEEPPPVAGAAFPIVPPLVLVVTGQSSGRTRTIRFDDTARRDARYVRNLRAYYDEMRTAFAGPADRLLARAMDVGTPMSRLVFEDYFAAILKELRAELERVVRERGPLRMMEALDDVDYESVAASVSRFTQAGLRPPNEAIPDDRGAWPALTLAPLYGQTGQQFPMDLGPADYVLDLQVPAEVRSWLRPAEGGTRITIAAGDTGAREAFAAFAALPLQPEILEKRWLPPLASRPLQLTLQQLTPWAGQGEDPRLVVAVSAQLTATLPPEGRGVELRAASGDDTPAVSWAPSVRVELTLSRVQAGRREGEVDPDGQAGEFVAHLYQLGGADERNRRVLEGALAGGGDLGSATLHLAYPAAGGEPGLRSRAAAKTVLLLKTNLSTESNPHAVLRLAARLAEAERDPVLATLEDRRDFLTLAWQAGVVSSGGFYLYYEDAEGNDLPADLFARGSTTPFTLLVTFPGGTGEPLRPWHNALVMKAANAEGDDAVTTLYARPQGVLEWDAANPAGSVAFEVRRRNPNRALTPPARLSLAPSDARGGVTRDEVLAAARAAGVAPGSGEERALLDEAGDEAAQLQNLFNLLQFRVRSGEEFRQSVWSVPLGPGTPDHAPDAGARFRALRAERGFTEPADWLYQQVPAVFRFSKESQGNPDPNRYAGVGGSVRLEFRVLDMFGNVMDDSDPVNLAATEVLFYDRLVAPDAWPGCALEYHLAREEGAARLKVVIQFAPRAVVPRAGEGEGPDRDQEEAAAGARVAWARVFDQLRDPRTAAAAWFSVVPDDALAADTATLAAFARAVRDWLGAIHHGEPWPAEPPAELALEWAIPDERVDAHADESFRVEAALRLRRTDLVAPEAAKKNPAAEQVQTPVPPHIPREPGTGGDGPQRLQLFAERFETAFAGRLKLALGAETGVAGEGGGTDEVGGELWAVRVGAPGGIVVTPGSGRFYFAPAPVSRHLATGTFSVRRYVDGAWKGTAEDYVEADATFAQVDLDAWAAAFLAGVDALLAPSLSAAVARLAPESFRALMDFKEEIARAIADTVAPVFDDGAGDRDAAVEAMYQRLLIRLAAAYEVDTIVQLPMTVRVPPPPVGDFDEPRYYGSVAAEVPEPTDLPAAPDASVAQFSVARLSLRPPDGSSGEFVRPLTFLFTAAHPTERRSFAGRLRWTVGFLEHREFTPVARAAGERAYLPSSWLRFVRTPSPELAVELGGFEVPVPLRRFPDSPDLVLQSATPTHPRPRTLAEALRWSYRVEYRQREIAQDRVVLDADYNVREEAPRAFERSAGEGERPLPRSLFEALARWSSESPALWAHAPAVAAAADGDETRKVEALAVIARFTDLVRGAAATWAAHHPARAVSLAGITDRYWLEDEEGGELVRVRRFRGAAGFPVWPEIAGYAPVDPPPADDAEDRLYRRLSAGKGLIPLAPEIARALAFPGHRLAERQNALGRLRIVRNARLSDERATNPAFVYETAPVSFGNPVTPLVSASGLSLDDLPGANLPAKLASFFTAVFEPEVAAPGTSVADDERLIRLEVGYRYALAHPEGMEPLYVTLPLLLLDDYRFRVGTDWNPDVRGSLARQLVAALADWHRRERPAGASAALTFTLVMFSSLGADTLPLLTLNALPLSAPADPAWWAEPG